MHAGLSAVRVGGWLTAGLLAAVATFSPAPRVALGAVSVTAINSGNPTCAALAPVGSTWSELKIQNAQLANGTYTNGTLIVTISGFVDSSSSVPGSFDWTSNIGIDAVFVKAGSDKHNLFRYDPEATAGAHLGPQTGRGNGISHISFCYDETTPPTSGEDDPTDDPSDDPTDDPSDDPSDDPTPFIAVLVDENGYDDPGDDLDDSPTDAPVTVPFQAPSASPSPAAPSQAAVLGAVSGPTATPHVGAVLAETSGPTMTLPPTDTVAGAIGAQSDGWRVILLGLALIIAALLLVAVPARRRR
jgi:hypothetical protein